MNCSQCFRHHKGAGCWKADLRRVPRLDKLDYFANQNLTSWRATDGGK